MAKDLKEIPFGDGSLATVLTSVCALLMFLTFLSYSFSQLFLPPVSLVEAQQAPGYVLEVPAPETVSPDLPGVGVAPAPVDILKHVFSSLEDVVNFREFTLKDYAPLLVHFEPKIANTPYLEVRLSRHHHVDDATFRADMEGLAPGVEIQTRAAFFERWTAHLSHISSACRALAVLMGVALMLSITVLLGNCFKMHRETIQTLSFLGASQSFVTGKFRQFFRGRFLMGSAVGLVLAFCFFVPLVWVLNPSLPFNVMAVQALSHALVLGGVGYVVLFFLLHFILLLHGKRLV